MRKLKLPPAKTHLLPLGAEIYYGGDHDYSALNLLYIGTLNLRHIYQTIEGFSRYLKQNIDKQHYTYTIIGYGNPMEEEKIKHYINKYGMTKNIFFEGRKNYTQLNKYLKKCNVGISWIPMTPFFDKQPATKTIEFILSGLICLATNTFENAQLINNTNGILCNDTPGDFCRALSEIDREKKDFNSSEIRNSLINYEWKNIIQNNLKSYLMNLK